MKLSQKRNRMNLRKMHYFVFLLLLAGISSCQKSRLEQALEAAGGNRSQLEKVLDHYRADPADSLKLKAAHFLIENMPHHYTMHGEVLNKYFQEIDTINKYNRSAPVCREKYDSLKSVLGSAWNGVEIVHDIQTITADYLIENIDMAVSSWQEGLWATHLSFDEFCEYILPYRFGTEHLTDWRPKFKKKYQPRIEWVDNEDNKRHMSYWASLYLNDQIKGNGFWLADMFDSPIDFPATLMENMRMGSCVNYAQNALSIMRACGVPVAVDFTPQWPFRSMNHTWNVVLDNNGLDIPFMGSESNPGYPNKPAHIMAKAFRYMYGYQENSLFALKGREEVPSLFNNPFLKDVSHQYFRGTDVQVKLNRKNNPGHKFAYLAVFDNQNWVPVHWGKIGSSGRTTFSCMGRNIVYLPIYYKNERMISAGEPFLLDYSGRSVSLTPDRSQTQQMVLRRKFPIFGGVLWYSTRVVNAKIEGANRPDFKDAVLLAQVTRNPLMRYDTVQNRSAAQAFRYYRYITPEKGRCNLAELDFFRQNKPLPHGAILTNPECPAIDGFGPENVFDGDGLTYYETHSESDGWIGMDFGEPVIVDYFRYLPRNDDNNVTPGNDYELLVWENDEWTSLGRQIAETESLIFNDVPVNGLYRLKNHTRGREERIFTFKDGKQQWW